MTLALHQMRPEHIEAIALADGGPWWQADRAYWTECLAAQTRGERYALIATLEGVVAGYGYLIWNARHQPFRQAGIPEISDLRVGERYRRKGVAAAMIARFESLAVAAGRPAIGIGVGLYADYGSAQRLYVRLGYIPDGGGVTYKNSEAKAGAAVPLDDHLILWLSKVLVAEVR